jgi:hypothetical protein
MDDDNGEPEKDANGNWVYDKGSKKRINSDVDDDPFDSASKVKYVFIKQHIILHY